MANNPDYGEMISGIMNSPEAMSNVMKIAQSLMGGAAPASTGQQSSTPASAQSEDSTPALYTLDAQGEADTDEVQEMGALSNSGNPGNSGNTGEQGILSLPLPQVLTDKETAENREKLLVALKPYLGDERRSMIDTILRLLKLAKLADIGKLLSGIK